MTYKLGYAARMRRTFDFLGAIFDVDDTLLDNAPDSVGSGLHERSRLAAVVEVGKTRGLRQILNISPEQNVEDFRTAKTSTVEAAVWNTLSRTGIVELGEIDLENEILKEIVRLKHQLHKDVLREYGKEVAGASAFVRSMAALGLKGKLAIASSGIGSEIELFLEMVGLSEFFSSNQIISKEKVRFHKPHPEPFELAFASLDLPDTARRKVLAFEDDPRGVLAAQGAGLFVCAITTTHSRELFSSLEVPPDLIADSFAEFEKELGLDADPG